MALAPVDYGPQTQPDTQGLDTMQRAVAQHEAVFQEARQLGGVIQGGAQAITQGILHTQALKATAAVKERQASTLQFIDSNPYVPKAVLQQRMAPDDYTAWHAGLATEYQKADAVPMFTAAGALFDSEAKQSRDAAGQIISLPGWRDSWGATEQTESATIRERYVNRLAADQMIADHRAQSLMAIDKMVDSAVKPEDLDTAAKSAETNPWLKPAERRFTMEKVLVARDSFVARQAMLGGDTEVMHSELMKLKSDKSADMYPNMNVKQRLDLANELGREYSYKAAKDTAEKQIVGPNVDVNGKVNTAAINKAITDYNGPNKADVVKAAKIAESERLDIFNAQMVDLQHKVWSAGQNPLTAEFSMAQAMKNPDARKAAMQLNKDAPGLLTALGREDQRNQNIATRESNAEKREAKANLIIRSGENLEAIHKLIDDPAQSNNLRSMTVQQFDSQLFEQEMTPQDRDKARAYFTSFVKNGGKPDERPATVVNSELSAAAKGDTTKFKELSSKYGDALREAAHKFIRDNPTLPPDKMSDALRAHIRAEMLTGKVVGSSSRFIPDDSARRIDWETNSKYEGKDFKLPDGTIIGSGSQRVRLTSPDGKQSGTFSAEDAMAARADGWK
jgi:hypothetical protein